MPRPLIAYPFKDVRHIVYIAINVFKKDIFPPSAYVTEILDLARIYRVGGLKKLETEEESLYNRSDPQYSNYPVCKSFFRSRSFRPGPFL